MKDFILALDQGTTGSAALVFDGDGRIVGSADREIRQSFPQSGWVEHDPEEIFQTTVAMGREALASASISASDVAAIGIANQRETTIVWDRQTGTPIYPAIVWQSRVSAGICQRMRAEGLELEIRRRTGLVLDAYFSATKLRWLLDNVPEAGARAAAGDLLFGTVESWLVWRLTGGRAHVSDVSNASRTLLFNIDTLDWDDDLLQVFGVPRSMLPRIVGNSEFVAETDSEAFGAPIAITGVAGDQQAALFGQGCLEAGQAKNTYGTGCFLLVNTGNHRPESDDGLLSTVAWRMGDDVTYALEGSAFVTGAAVQWLRDGLGVIQNAAETDAIAQSVSDTEDVYFVPAFVGLGAPDWDMRARGLLIGLTGGTSRAQIVRATLESIAFQTRDLTEAMGRSGQPTRLLKVDGGGTANEFLMQFQADILGVPVIVSPVRETTALGAAALARLGASLDSALAWPAETGISARQYEPRMSAVKRDECYGRWREAVSRARSWAS